MKKEVPANRIFVITILVCFIIGIACSRITLATFMFSLAIVMTALISFALAFVFSRQSKQRDTMLFFGICCLLIGVWFFCSCNEVDILVGDKKGAWFMASISQGLLAPVFLVFNRRGQQEDWGEYALDRIMDVATVLLILGIPVAIAFHYFFSYSLLSSPALDLFILALVVCSVLRLRRMDKGETRSGMAFGLSLAMFIIYLLELMRHVEGLTLMESRLFSAVIVLALLNVSWVLFMQSNYLKMEENNAMREQLIQGRMQLMLSQIQPHFIYNALNSIHIMIRKDPDVACNMITNFSAYLRANMDAMASQKLAAMKEELAHIRAYGAIEKVRFPKIDVIYEIDEWNFYLPVLTVEPLVENAIKHGVARMRDGGVVNIRVYKSRGYIYIEVKDNGAGFDTAILEEESKSIGIKNVRYRLEKMMGGTLHIKSTVGIGTVAQIKIPVAMAEGSKYNENNLG